jgi:tRNA(Ile)-lysidine synthase TilS/MesJ
MMLEWLKRRWQGRGRLDFLALSNGNLPMADPVNRVVLAFSGGLDTSVILKWLQQTYQCEVVTFTADLGQGEELGPARTIRTWNAARWARFAACIAAWAG